MTCRTNGSFEQCALAAQLGLFPADLLVDVGYSSAVRERIRATGLKQIHRPPLDYEEMQIPLGSILKCTLSSVCVAVVSPRTVALGGIELSLSRATARILGDVRGRDPAKYWAYGDRTVQEIYDATYPRGEDCTN